jgi:hypothetical protein
MEETKHLGGRPTKYDPIFIQKVDEYLQTTGKEQMHLPKMESFALYINVNGDTLVEWGKIYPEFSAALKKLMARQKEQLIDDGIYGGKEVNSTIVKLILQNNHGMKERTDTTSADKQIVGFNYLPPEKPKDATTNNTDNKTNI